MGVIVPSFRQEGISSSERIWLKILYSHFIRIWPLCSAVMLSGPAALPDFSLCIAVEISWMLIFPFRMLLSLLNEFSRSELIVSSSMLGSVREAAREEK